MQDHTRSAEACQRYKKRAIPQETRRAVALRYGCEPGDYRHPAFCHYCGAEGSICWQRLYSGRPGAWVSFPGLELDHYVPESAGGPSTPDNIVLACRSCNRRKSSSMPEVAL